MNSDRQIVFEILQPPCIKLTKEPTRENVCALHNALKKVDKKYIQEVQEYVLFPLRVVSKSKRTNGQYQDLYTELFTCLGYILEQIKVTGWETFYDFFNILTIHLDGSFENFATVSEEFKGSAVLCLSRLMRSAECDVIIKLFSVTFLPALGHYISVLLSISEREKAKRLKLASIECLVILTQLNSQQESFNKNHHIKLLSSFLPGISICLTRVITGDDKQSTAVVVSAISAWKTIVGLLMNDGLELEEKVESYRDLEDSRLKHLVVLRTTEWVQGTAEKLDILVKQIIHLKTHPNWKVRLALVDWTEYFLSVCSKSMHISIPSFLEVPVGLIGDEYTQVSSKSATVLQVLSQEDGELGRKVLEEILEENLLMLTSSLPRQIRMVDEQEKLSVVNSLLGYLTILGPKINRIFLSSTHLRKLAICLVQTLEMDCSDIKILEKRADKPYQMSPEIQSESSFHRKPRKTFQHFHDERIGKVLMNICRLLGRHGNINSLIDQFIDLFSESSVYKLQSLFIINEIVNGVFSRSSIMGDSHKTGSTMQNALCFQFDGSHPIDFSANRSPNEIGEKIGFSKQHSPVSPGFKMENIIKMLIDEYLSDKNFYLKTSFADDEDKDITVKTKMSSNIVSREKSTSVSQMNRNVMQICLILEGLGIFSKVLSHSFKPYLIKVLYPMLEQLGHTNLYISSAAYSSIQEICQYCDYPSISSLIENNADYLMNSISLLLRHFLNNKTTPLVLKVILQYCTCDILPVVEDIIQDILISFDDHYMDETVLFLNVLHELSLSIKRWFPPRGMQNSQESANEGSCNAEAKDFVSMTFSPNTDTTLSELKVGDGKATIEEIEKYFINYHKLKQTAEGNVTETDFLDEDLKDNENVDPKYDAVKADEEQEEKGLPKHVEILKDVMKRTKHVLSSANPRNRLAALSILSACCEAVVDYQNELLPLLHDSWAPFANRFLDEEKMVIVKALQTLVTICKCSKGFLNRRVMSDILPKLTNFLVPQGKISLQSGQAYLYTVNFKLQKCILENIAIIARYTELDSSEIDKIADACSCYLSGRQPKQLQKMCLDMFEELICLEPDVIWLKLNDLYCPNEYKIPTPDFHPITFCCETGKRNEFTENVMKLLNSRYL